MRVHLGTWTLAGLMLVPALPFVAGLPLLSPEPPREPCTKDSDYEHVEGQGPSCPVPGGWILRYPDGSRAFTHGPDVYAEDTRNEIQMPAPVAPRCVASTESRHSRLLIVHPLGSTPGAGLEGEVRTMVEKANAQLRLDSSERGVQAEFIFRCDGAGRVEATHVDSQFTSPSDFRTITVELKQKGFTEDQVKYWVFYDGSNVVPLIAGQATMYNDDQAGAANENLQGGSFALTWGQDGDWGASVMMHENGHNLGAVQDSSPNTSGAGHCNDGKDIMCYGDGGPQSAYTETTCSDRFYYDCRGDDYFNVAPAPGSYLASHWNVGSSVNDYLLFTPVAIDGRPSLAAPTCLPTRAALGRTITCGLSPSDRDSTQLSLAVDWGDGTPVETLDAASGSTVSVGHAYTAAGTFVLSVVASDGALESDARTRELVAYDPAACTLDAHGSLEYGLPLLGIGNHNRVEVPIAAACHGHAYVFGTGEGGQFQLCWAFASSSPPCQNVRAGERGTIPAGTTKVDIQRTSMMGSKEYHLVDD